jgi:pimeloyl-ACP methyl ester carboxylesterase
MDIGRDGPTIVLLHGLLMDGSLWHNVATELARDHRCVVPTLPLGAHRCGMRADADLSVAGIAALVRELIERLDLHDVTIAGVDTGGAIAQLLMGQNVPRIGRAVLISCDAFENFPPGLTGKALVMAGKLPPALFGVFMQQLRLRWMRRLPIAYGWLTKTGDAATKLWLRPLLTQPEVRRDTVRVLRAIAAEPQLLVDASTGLPGFAHPTLVIWAAGDRVMPPEHGRRLAELLPQARLVEVDDTYTLIPLDQPGRLIELMREFTNSTDRQAG